MMKWKEDRGILWAFDEDTGTLEIAKTDRGSGRMPEYKGTEAYTEEVFVDEYEGSIDYDYLGEVYGTIPAHTEYVTSTRVAYTQPWKEWKDKIVRAVIHGGITAIGNYTFYDHPALREVELPDTVTEIGWHSFENCTSLERIFIPRSVKEIGWNAFQNCRSLKDVTISEGVTFISGYAFFGCVSLEKIVIPDSVENIMFNAFRDCGSLRVAEIPRDLKLEREWKLFGSRYEPFDKDTKVVRRK